MDFTRLFEVLEYQQHRYPLPVAAAGRENDAWRTWSTADMLAERDRLSAGLLQLGLQAGDRMGILTHCGSPRWLLADAALLQIGVLPVPIHAVARPDEISHIIRDAGLRGCFVSNADMLGKIQETGSSLEFLISFEALAGTRAWETVMANLDDHLRQQIQERREAVSPASIATLLYTSGTTGLPKGVMLTHHNIVSNVKSVLAIVPVGPEAVAVSFLPMSHILERMVSYVYQASGTPVWFASTVESLPKVFAEVRPHFFTAVPRILERMYERLLELRSRSGWLRKKIIDWAINLGQRFPSAGVKAMPPAYQFQLMVADFLVYRRWRRQLGGRIQYIAVGAAALRPSLGRLFSAAGIEVREGYGLTETSPVIAFNRFEPGGVRFGTVGISAPGVEVRIANPDESGAGEIEVSGPNVMCGYWNLPDETAARFTADGWFKTGDTGRIEHKRFLRITGRISELFKTTSGKFVAPAYVEQQLLTSPYISQCMALGLNQPYVGALIVPDFVQLEAWCLENKVHWTAPQYMVLNPKVEKLFKQELERLNESLLGPNEAVKSYHLLFEPWTPENGLLTPTLKLRREVIGKAFEEEIGKLWKK